MDDCCVTIQELVDKVMMSTGSVHSILKDLGMWRVSAKFVL